MAEIMQLNERERISKYLFSRRLCLYGIYCPKRYFLQEKDKHVIMRVREMEKDVMVERKRPVKSIIL